MILGEHNLICLTDTGVIKFVKKLDYTPISFFSFVIGWYYGEYLVVVLLLRPSAPATEAIEGLTRNNKPFCYIP